MAAGSLVLLIDNAILKYKNREKKILFINTTPKYLIFAIIAENYWKMKLNNLKTVYFGILLF